MNFVVVDNNKSDLDLFAKAIRKAMPECQIQPFTDPLLSAKYICNNPVDMVFIADDMRPVNGFRLMQVLHKNIPKLAVVMLSDSDLNRVDAIHAGADDYLLKPISPHMLWGLVKQTAI
ncbi:MAG: response regulator [Oscillospiraceae bacterium]